MMFLETKPQKKSAVITSVILAVLIAMLFVFGLSYMEPPIENGIAVNFGTSSVGQGKQETTEPVKSSPQKSSPQPEPQKSSPAPEESSSEVNEKVVTQEKEKAPVIKDKKEKEKTKKTEKKKNKKKEENPKEKPEKSDTKEKKKKKPAKKTEEKTKPEPKPDESTTNTLNEFLDGPKKKGQAKKGEGNDNKAGNKGKESGDPNASSYYGQGKGDQGSGNYRLAGRKALVKKTFIQDCNQSGVVVVRIQVNRMGEVIQATPGVKGTTNSDPCLMKPAKKAALNTKFNKDMEAPAVQTGKIIYEFKLSD